MNQLFEILSQNDLIKNDRINDEKIKRMSTSQILDITKETLVVTSMESTKPDKSIFSHSASISLAGGRFPCNDIECRAKNVKELAQFSAFYSDRVYIRNFLSDYTSHDFIKAHRAEDDIKQSFKNDLILLIYLKPLIISGNIVPITPPNWCTHCLLKNYLGTSAGEQRYYKVQKDLFEQYRKELECSVMFDDDGALRLTVQGPKYLLEHSTTTRFHQIPDVIRENTTLMSRLKFGGAVRLSREIVKEIEIDKGFADEVFTNITFDMSTSQYLGTSFLTERKIDTQILQKISLSPELIRRNQIIQKYLTCLVPVIKNVEPSALLELRREEDDSFLIFRGALNKTIDEYIKNKKDFSEQDAKTLYNDIIQPQLSKLNIAVRGSKLDAIKKSSTKFLSWGGAITIGLYAGLLPSELAAAATALGLVPLIAELANDIMSLHNDEKEIRKEDFYFLWKATR